MPREGHESITELSIMKKLLIPAGEIMAMDAMDFSDGDRLLKEMGKDVRSLTAQQLISVLPTDVIILYCCSY